MSQHRSRQPRSRRLGVGIAVLAALALMASALTGSALAAPGSGQVNLSLTGAKSGSLLAQGVKVTYVAKAGRTGATKSAKRRGKAGAGSVALELPVSEVALRKRGGRLTVDGALKLRAGKRSIRLNAIELQAGGQGATLGAKLGKKRLVVFRASGDTKLGADSIKLTGAKLSLTAKGAARLGRRLGLSELAAGETGRLRISAKARPRHSDDVVTPPVPTPPADDDKPTPDPGPPYYPYAAECPVPTGASSDPPGIVAGIAPAPTFDVGQEVTGTSIEWGFKDSLREYVLNSPPPGSLPTLGGAGANPAGPTMATAGSFFDFPLAEGTYEAGTEPDHSDDKLVADGSGTVLFCKAGHGFNVVLKDPTVTIDGEDSRITADVGVNSQGTWYPFQRVDIAELDLGAVGPTITDGGNTLVWEDMPATLTADGREASSLGGFYPIGTALDEITVRTSLERPLLSQCGIDAGTGSLPRPAVDFTLDDLPELTDPVEASGGDLGTINWGFRRATRNSAVSSGGYQLLGGATEGYPGNMGGLATPAPDGGIGKFFRFPISEYAYEEGTPAADDDRLIATSNATVGICNSNPMTGNFAVVISKPTLVIDDENSRIVANAYSYRGPDFGWAGGRVDLVNLDTSSATAVAGAGVVSWGEVLPDETPLTNGIPIEGGLPTNALTLATLPEGSGSGGFDPVAAQIELPAP